MFSKRIHLYDLIYSFKDYTAESNKIIGLLKQEHPGARTLLDGKRLSYTSNSHAECYD